MFLSAHETHSHSPNPSRCRSECEAYSFSYLFFLNYLCLSGLAKAGVEKSRAMMHLGAGVPRARREKLGI